LSEKSIAFLLDIHYTNLSKQKKKVAELNNAIKRGRLLANKDVVQALFANATMKCNVVAQIFWLCNRDRDSWRNVNKIEHIGSTDKPIRFVIEDAKNDKNVKK
jgi:hypothetical protein